MKNFSGTWSMAIDKPMELACRDCGATLGPNSFFSPDTGRHLCGAEPKTIVMTPPVQPGAGPPCIWDNAPTRRSGMCYVCTVCGNSTSC